MTKFTREKIKTITENRGYIFIDEYMGNKSQRRIIMMDKNGYKYNTLLSIVKNKKRKPNFVDKSNPYTLTNIKLWIKKNNKNFSLHKTNKIFEGSSKKLLLHCKVCKDNFWMSWNKILMGRNCGLCAGQTVGKYNNLAYLRPDLVEEWDYELNKITPDSIVCGHNGKVNWICSKCNHKWEASVTSRNRGNGCPICKIPHNELKIKLFLENNKIKYVPQKRFNDCRNIKPLPFDFYLPDYNVCVEYDGELHYQTHRYIKKVSANKKLRDCRKRDKIKTKYCRDNKIKLIRIPYWKSKEISVILEKELLK